MGLLDGRGWIVHLKDKNISIQNNKNYLNLYKMKLFPINRNLRFT